VALLLITRLERPSSNQPSPSSYTNPSLTRKRDPALRRLTLPFLLFPGLLPLALAGCSEGYSLNTYAAAAAQQQATVQRGVIIGLRPVQISADGTVGAAAGGAVGGVAGAQASGGPVTTALGAVGGALVGGIAGTAAEQAVADTNGWEYIVQETSGSLVSVTQTSKMALSVGLHVLVIDGKQARIVPDYTVQIAAAAPTAKVPKSAAGGTKPAMTKATQIAAASNVSTTTPLHVSPLPPAAGAAGPVQAAPGSVASGPTVPSAPRPASAAPAATPLAPSSTSGEAATPEAASNRSSATGTPSAGSTATSVQVAPGVSMSIPPVSSPSTATP
jgi:outer membrane lipoprotein SlyB